MLTGIPVSRGPDVAVPGEAAQQGQTVDLYGCDDSAGSRWI